MYHLKDAKESNGVVGVFKKNNSEYIYIYIYQKTPTVNKVFLSPKTQPGFDARHHPSQRKLSQSQDSLTVGASDG